MVENRKIITPRADECWRSALCGKPNLFKMSGMVSFRRMAASACGMMSNPDWIGENPRPTWYSSGSRKGIPPIPSRVKRLPVTATRKLRIRTSPKRNSGCAVRMLCRP